MIKRTMVLSLIGLSLIGMLTLAAGADVGTGGHARRTGECLQPR